MFTSSSSLPMKNHLKDQRRRFLSSYQQASRPFSSEESEDRDTDSQGLSLQDRKLERLVKNRESAQLSRIRKKRYVVDLEQRTTELARIHSEMQLKVQSLAAENQTLREQLMYLRNVIAPFAANIAAVQLYKQRQLQDLQEGKDLDETQHEHQLQHQLHHQHQLYPTQADLKSSPICTPEMFVKGEEEDKVVHEIQHKREDSCKDPILRLRLCSSDSVESTSSSTRLAHKNVAILSAVAALLQKEYNTAQ